MRMSARRYVQRASKGPGKEGGMKRRDFIVKSGMLLSGAGMACCGLFGCGKKEEQAVEEAVDEVASMAETALSRVDQLKKDMMDKMGLSEADVAAKMKEFQDMLPMVKEQCICAACPSYVEGETELGFCHPMVGKSDKITERKGCTCPECPVFKKMGMKRGYYCIMGSKLELDLAEK
jgi:hypothetical protein